MEVVERGNHADQAGDAQGLEDALLRPDHAEPSAKGLRLLHRADEHAEAGGVEEVEAGHLDGDAAALVARRVVEDSAQAAGRVDVELADQFDHQPAAVQPRVHLEHRVNAGSTHGGASLPTVRTLLCRGHHLSAVFRGLEIARNCSQHLRVTKAPRR